MDVLLRIVSIATNSLVNIVTLKSQPVTCMTESKCKCNAAVCLSQPAQAGSPSLSHSWSRGACHGPDHVLRVGRVDVVGGWTCLRVHGPLVDSSY